MHYVACPKCHGGCDLCGGSGQVRTSVASIYTREEQRATTKMVRIQPFPDELPTRPEIIRRADRRARIARYVVIVVIGAALGVILGTTIAALLR